MGRRNLTRGPHVSTLGPSQRKSLFRLHAHLGSVPPCCSVSLRDGPALSSGSHAGHTTGRYGFASSRSASWFPASRCCSGKAPAVLAEGDARICVADALLHNLRVDASRAGDGAPPLPPARGNGGRGP